MSRCLTSLACDVMIEDLPTTHLDVSVVAFSVQYEYAVKNVIFKSDYLLLTGRVARQGTFQRNKSKFPK